MSASGFSPLPPLVSLILVKTLPTDAASFAVSPIPPMCMNMTLGESQKKWLWSAVTSRPLSSATLMTGLTWSSASTMSPITIVSLPLRLKAAQDVNPIGGVRCTPAALTVRSLRGTETLNAPSFSSSLPLAPVNCSMEAVSNPVAGALLLLWSGSARAAMSVEQMRPRIVFMFHLRIERGPRAAGRQQGPRGHYRFLRK